MGANRAEEIIPIPPLEEALANPELLFGQLAPAPYIDRFQSIFGSQGLTPQNVSSILNFANLGYLYSLADLLEEIREVDAHLAAVVGKREDQVAGADWDIVPDDPKDDDQARIAKWVKSELRSVRGFQHAASHLMSGIYYGHAVCESLWVRVNNRPRLVELIPLHPRRFAYAATTDYRLYLWDQLGNDRQPRAGHYPGIPLDRCGPGKFVWHTPRVRGGYPQREGLGRTLVWYSMMKRTGFRDLMALIEWAGRGLRVGYYNTGREDGAKNKQATSQDQSILRNMLNTFSSASPAVLADTTKLDVIQPARDNDIHERLVAMCDAQMSKATLGSTLTTETGKHGNRNLGETQRDEQLMLAISDEKQLSESIGFCLIAPMVRYQFGAAAPIPRIRFAVAPQQSRVEDARLLGMLVDAGMEIGQSYGYERFSIPKPKAGERLMVPKRVSVSEKVDTSPPAETEPPDTIAPAA